MDGHGSGKCPGSGTNETGTELLVSVKCGKFLGYLNESIPKEGTDESVWVKDVLSKVKLETVSH